MKKRWAITKIQAFVRRVVAQRRYKKLKIQVCISFPFISKPIRIT